MVEGIATAGIAQKPAKGGEDLIHPDRKSRQTRADDWSSLDMSETPKSEKKKLSRLADVLCLIYPLGKVDQSRCRFDRFPARQI
jgi:hypothetical protein